MRQTAAAVAADHYVQRLDLGMDPFAEGFRSDYFYAGGQRRQLLEQVLHFTQFSDQVVLLVGSTGSGTSAVLGRLLDQLEPLMDFCSLDAEGIAFPDQILNTLGNQLQSGAINSVPEFIAELRYHTGGEPLLVAVDQAHFLGLEGLELLRQLYTQAAGALHLLLVGEYQVEQLTKLSGFDTGKLKVLELEPLDIEETGEYVLGLLQSVGYAGEQPLSVDQLAVLHEQSGGNIAEIHVLMPKLLNAGRTAAPKKLHLAIPISHLAAIIVLLVAIGFSYWYEGDADVPPAALAPASTGSPGATVTRRLDLSAKLSPAQAKDTESTVGDNAASPPRQLQVAAAERRPVNQPDDAAATAEAKDRVAATGPAFSDNDAPSENKPGRNTSEVEEQKTGGEVRRVERELPDVSSGQPDPSPAVAPKSTAAVERVETPATPSGVEEPVKKAAPAARPDLPQRERRLLSLSDTGYMLQLMGAVEEDRAQAMVSAYAGRLPVTYFESRRKDKPWFVVVTGPYATRDTARAGIERLPSALQRQKPWVRSVAGVQDEIRDNRF